MASTSLENLLLPSGSTLCTLPTRTPPDNSPTFESLVPASPIQVMSCRTSQEQSHPKPVANESAKLAHPELQSFRMRLSVRQPSAGEEISSKLVYKPRPDTSAATQPAASAGIGLIKNPFDSTSHEKYSSHVLPHESILATNSTVEAEIASNKLVTSEKRQQFEQLQIQTNQKENQTGHVPKIAAFIGSNSSEEIKNRTIDCDTNPETRSQGGEPLAGNCSGSKKKVRWLQIQDYCNYTLEQKYSTSSMKDLSHSPAGTEAQKLPQLPLDLICEDAGQQANMSPTAKVSPISDNTSSVFTLDAQCDENRTRVSPVKLCVIDNDDNRSRQSGTTSQKTPRAGILKNKARMISTAKEDQTSNLSILSESASRDNESQLAWNKCDKRIESTHVHTVGKMQDVQTISEQCSSDEACSDSSSSKSPRPAKDYFLIGALMLFSLSIVLWEIIGSQ
jgi:hypothetical protein